MVTRDRLGGIVLGGGRSRRMGCPKEWLLIGGEPLLLRAIRTVGALVRRVVVAVRAGQALPDLPPEVAVVHDYIIDGGPLAGMAAGMEVLRTDCEAAIVTPCDHPGLRGAFLMRLVEELGDAAAVVPELEGRVYPLLGVYRTDTWTALRDAVERGDARAGDFATRCGAKIVDAQRFRNVDPRLESLLNVNEPGDLARFECEAGSEGPLS